MCSIDGDWPPSDCIFIWSDECIMVCCWGTYNEVCRLFSKATSLFNESICCTYISTQSKSSSFYLWRTSSSVLNFPNISVKFYSYSVFSSSLVYSWVFSSRIYFDCSSSAFSWSMSLWTSLVLDSVWCFKSDITMYKSTGSRSRPSPKLGEF